MAQQGNYFDQFDDPRAAAKANTQGAKDAADIRQSGASAASAEATAERTRALTPAEIREKNASAAKAEAEAEEKRVEVETAKEASSPEAKEFARRKKLDDLNNLLANTAQARDAIGFWSTGPAGQVAENIWGTPAQDLTAAIEAIKSPIVLEALQEARKGSAVGATGFGALSQRELDIISASIASLKRGQSPEQLMENLNRIETHFRRFSAYNNGLDPDTPEGAQWAGLAKPTDNVAPAGEITGDKTVVTDPGLAGANATIEAMIKSGRTAEEIRAWLNSVQEGAGDRLENVEEQIRYWKSGGEPDANVETVLEPATGLSAAIGAVAESPVGAALIGAGDVASMGFLDELTPNQPMSEAIMRRSQERNPTATLLGQLGGGLATGVGLEGLAARYGIKALPGLGLDVLQGAAYGAGSASEGNRLSGATAGGILGGVGGVGARGAAKATGTVARGVQDPMVQLLRRYNVPMTIGQMTQGGMKAFEDRATSWPLVGGAIAKRREESLEGFNRAAFDEALQPIGASTQGQIGQGGIIIAQDAVAKAYDDALGDVTLQVDKPFLDVISGQPLQDLASVPRVGAEAADDVRKIIQAHIDPQTGTMTGKSLQAARQEVRRLKKTYQNSPDSARLYDRLKPSLDAVEDSFIDLLGRQAPDRVGPFLNADEAYKRVQIVGEALDFSGAASDDMFSAAKLREKSRQATRTFSGKHASQAGRRPFNELDKAGRALLPSSIGDSGTAGRLLLPALAAGVVGGGSYASSAERPVGVESAGGEGGGAFGSALLGLGAAGLVAAPYSKYGQRLATAAIAGDRNAASRWIGDALHRYADPAARAIVPQTAEYGIDRVPEPDVEGSPPFEPVSATLPTEAAAEPTPAEMPGIPEGSVIDPDTGELVLPDGTRIPLAQKAKGGAVGYERDWGDAAREALKGATFAHGDELEAAVRSAATGRPYRAEVDRIRAQMDRASDAAPISSVGWEVAGSVLPVLAARRPTAGASSKLSQLAQRYPALAAARSGIDASKMGRFAMNSIPEMAMAAAYGAGEAKTVRDIPASMLREMPEALATYAALSGLVSGGGKLYNRYMRKGR